MESYGWEEFKGLSKISFNPKEEGKSLYVINKGTFQRNLETWTGHTMLAQYGIYFNAEEIKKIEGIFNKHGLKKQDQECDISFT